MKAFIHLYAALIAFRTEKSPEQADVLANELIRLLQQHQQSMPETLVEEFEIHLRNHWTARYQHTRDEKYPLLMHQLQLLQVERLRSNDRAVPASQLTNILFAALKMNKIEWAKEILSWLGPRIMGAHAEMINSILRTRLLHEEKLFAAAAASLPHYITYGELKDMVFYTIAAKLDIKIHYELSDLLDEEHFNMFRATQIKLKRDKSLSRDRREQRERFFPLAMKLYRVKDYLRYNPQADVAKKLQEIWEVLADKTQPVVDADWLEDKWLELRQP